MGKNVTIVVDYGIQDESMIEHALEMVSADDRLHVLVIDFDKEEFKYNKEVDFRLFRNLADEAGAELDIMEATPRNALETAVRYAKKKKTEHLIIGEDREQIFDLILHGSFSNYILSRLPGTYLTIVPFSKSVDSSYFDYASGKRVFIVREGDSLVIKDGLVEEYDYEGIYYKSNYTDFETGVIYIYTDDKLVEKRVTEGRVEDME